MFELQNTCKSLFFAQMAVLLGQNGSLYFGVKAQKTYM